MFHKPDVAERPVPDRRRYDELIPLSVLALDLSTPVEGWTVYLERRCIEIVTDDLGRLAVARGDARRLFAEQRENEVRRAALREAAEQRAVEADQRFRAQLGVGVPASAIPAGMTYAAAVLSAELDGQAYRPRASVAEDLLDNSGGLTFHPIRSDLDEP